MSVSPKEFIKQFRAENPDEQLTYQAILNATGLKDLQKADLRDADLKNTILRNANLESADLRGADLQGANLWGVNLQLTNLQEADLRGAYLRDANLRYATLRGVDLQFANLLSANLQFTNLRNADLRNTDLQNADLRYADLRNAIPQGVILRDADLRHADLRGASLWDITILQLRGLPSGELTLYPTPDGWHLWAGDWQGTLEKLKTLVAEGKWPEVEDEEEIAIRRALFESIYPLIDRHITKNSDVIEELAEKWNTKTKEK